MLSLVRCCADNLRQCLKLDWRKGGHKTVCNAVTVLRKRLHLDSAVFAAFVRASDVVTSQVFVGLCEAEGMCSLDMETLIVALETALRDGVDHRSDDAVSKGLSIP